MPPISMKRAETRQLYCSLQRSPIYSELQTEEGFLDLTRIHKKLGEAQGWLGNMFEQDGLMTRGRFDDYLSAFLSAGMSVRDGFHYKQDRPQNAAVKAWCKKWECRNPYDRRRPGTGGRACQSWRRQFVFGQIGYSRSVRVS